MKIVDQTNDEMLSELISIVRKYDGDLSLAKKDKQSLSRVVHKMVEYEFKKVKTEHRQFFFRNNKAMSKFDGEFTWITRIKDYKSFIRSLSYLGETVSDDNKVEMYQLNKYMRGCKDNLLKQIGCSIAKTAVEKGCGVIVMEQLSSKGANGRTDNCMHALWSPERIKQAVANAAAWHGIVIMDVYEGCTSQVSSETGEFGYRDKEDKTLLWYIDAQDNLRNVHADENAADNIAEKALSRYASEKQISLKREPSKRSKGLLTKEFGDLKSAKEFFTEERFQESKYAYKHGDQWVTSNKKKEIQQSIELRVVKEIKIPEMDMTSLKRAKKREQAKVRRGYGERSPFLESYSQAINARTLNGTSNPGGFAITVNA